MRSAPPARVESDPNEGPAGTSLQTGVGNAVTVIDLNTFEPIENIVVEDAMPVGFPSSPVEVLFVRPEISELAEPSVLVNTMFGFEVWQIPFNDEEKTFGAPH